MTAGSDILQEWAQTQTEDVVLHVQFGIHMDSKRKLSQTLVHDTFFVMLNLVDIWTQEVYFKSRQDQYCLNMINR